MKKLICAAASVVALGAGAQPSAPVVQPLPPTDVDLKASYCTAVVQKWLKNTPAGTGVGDIDKLHDSRQQDLDRLRAYLVPRMAALDALGLLTAFRQGERDYENGLKEISQCIEGCGARDGGKCMLGCESKTYERTSQCQGLAFLPF
jgi:hypothetical protein